MPAEGRGACPQCGGPVDFGGDVFSACPHCEASLYVDHRTVIARAMAPTKLDKSRAVFALIRFLARLEVRVRPHGVRTRVLALPYYFLPSPDGTWRAVAAGATEDGASVSLRVDGRQVAELVPIPRPLPEGVTWVEPSRAVRALLDEASLRGARLVHVAFHEIRYAVDGEEYVAYVDAGTGEIDAERVPPSASVLLDRRHARLAKVAFAAFFLEAALLPAFWHVGVAVALTGVALLALEERAEARR